jgi:prepilin-type N-terminal cleavage/methylation domain-containing protein
MISGEKGYTFIELMVALGILVLVSGAAAIAIYQISKGTQENNTHMNAIRQVQNAGYWICRDARMAQSIDTDNLTLPLFLIFNWTEWDNDNEKIYHSANYTLEGLTDSIATLKRIHSSSAGANEETLIATHIYYEPTDPDDTTKADYQAPVLTLQLTSVDKDATEVREYHIKNRPNAY